MRSAPEAGDEGNVGASVSPLDQGQSGLPSGRESVAPADDLVRGTGRSPVGQVPEDPFRFLLAGDHSVLFVPSTNAEMGGAGGTINNETLWTSGHLFVNSQDLFCKYTFIFYFLLYILTFFLQIKTVFNFQ